MDNITDVQDEVRNWLDTNSTILSNAQITNFIRNIEADINARVKTEETIEKTRLYTWDDGEWLDLPTRFRGMRQVEYNEQELDYLTPEQMNALPTLSGDPRYYTVMDEKLRILPALSTSTSSSLYQPPSISSGTVSLALQQMTMSWSNAESYDNLYYKITRSGFKTNPITQTVEIGSADVTATISLLGWNSGDTGQIWLLATKTGGTTAQSSSASFVYGTSTTLNLNRDLSIPGTVDESLYYMDVYHYAELDPIDTTDGNWVLTKYPQIYLYGGLWQANMFLRDDNAAAAFKAMYDAEIDKIISRDHELKWSGGSMRMRTA